MRYRALGGGGVCMFGVCVCVCRGGGGCTAVPGGRQTMAAAGGSSSSSAAGDTAAAAVAAAAGDSSGQKVGVLMWHVAGRAADVVARLCL